MRIWAFGVMLWILLCGMGLGLETGLEVPKFIKRIKKAVGRKPKSINPALEARAKAFLHAFCLTKDSPTGSRSPELLRDPLLKAIDGLLPSLKQKSEKAKWLALKTKVSGGISPSSLVNDPVINKFDIQPIQPAQIVPSDL